MLSNTCKYAIRSIIYIGLKERENPNSLVNVRTIASDLDVPLQFLSKILQIYSRKGVLKSYKGPAGGFKFAHDAKKISLFDLVEIIEGPDLFEKCVIGKKTCHTHLNNNMRCCVHDKYSEVRNQLTDFFKNETIADIIRNYENNGENYLSL